jgi:hypothetical protein
LKKLVFLWEVSKKLRNISVIKYLEQARHDLHESSRKMNAKKVRNENYPCQPHDDIKHIQDLLTDNEITDEDLDSLAVVESRLTSSGVVLCVRFCSPPASSLYL